ncbi:hypothetical protein WN51_14156 [Melipona quadrifasciata]|uniref:Uncharacterized protein n=1 Tax=Melipona quadrifasciata TaxID=166423 RepID=A0A0M9A0U7_9HYME|nr:hypothetical protein WN51_14156 [Melipona quadrifasciata]
MVLGFWRSIMTRPRIPQIRVSNTRLAQAASGCAPSVDVLPIFDVKQQSVRNAARMGENQPSVWGKESLPSAAPHWWDESRQGQGTDEDDGKMIFKSKYTQDKNILVLYSDVTAGQILSLKVTLVGVTQKVGLPQRPRIPQIRVSNTRLAQAASGCAPSVDVLPIFDVKQQSVRNPARMGANQPIGTVASGPFSETNRTGVQVVQFNLQSQMLYVSSFQKFKIVYKWCKSVSPLERGIKSIIALERDTTQSFWIATPQHDLATMQISMMYSETDRYEVFYEYITKSDLQILDKSVYFSDITNNLLGSDLIALFRGNGHRNHQPVRIYQTTPLLLEVYPTPTHESRDPDQPIANFRCISVAPEEVPLARITFSDNKYSQVPGLTLAMLKQIKNSRAILSKLKYKKRPGAQKSRLHFPVGTVTPGPFSETNRTGVQVVQLFELVLLTELDEVEERSSVSADNEYGNSAIEVE